MLASAIAGNGQDDVGVDGSDGDVDDFELLVWESFAQEDLKVAAGPIGGLRVSHRRRLSENKDAIGVGGLVSCHPDWPREPSQFRWKEPEPILLVIYQEVLIADASLLEEAGGVAIPREAQGALQDAKGRQRHKQQRHQAKEPSAARAEGRG